MAERFKEVFEVAIAATEDPSLKAMLTTVGKLGDTGEVADEKLVELVETLTRVSQVDQAVSAFEGLTRSQIDTVMTGFRIGWLARETVEGADPDLSICDAMGGRLYDALLAAHADYEREAPTNQPDSLTRDSKP
jgi:hypothetical protein